MILVRASANCAPEWTQCSEIPSFSMSLMARAWSCVLNSEQFGTAVRVVKSYKLLQSVIARSFSSHLMVGTVMACGKPFTLLGSCHFSD